MLKIALSDKSLRLDHTAVLKALHGLISDIANGRLNTPILRPLLTTLRGVALRKKADSDDVRPIGIGQLFTTIAGTLAVRSADVTAKIAEGVGPTDWMHGHRGGCEALAHFAQA